jgi:prepilin signal peptidase PulO-like enzyme (type II secretory pathway)
MMTPNQLHIVFSIVAALIGALILAPLARIIPRRILEKWQETIGVSDNQPGKFLQSADFTCSRQEALVFGVCGGLVGLIASSAYAPMDEALRAGAYLLGLVLLVAINLRHLLLPDQIVYALMWAGLLFGVNTNHGAQYVLGAVLGYAGPFLLCQFVKARTGKEMMGRGDIKALAMAGAWFGAPQLPLLFAAFAGAVILLAVLQGVRGQNQIGTGPAHFAASLACMCVPRLL